MEQEKKMVEISQEELEELQALRAERAEREAEARRADDRAAYRKMERDFVAAYFGQLEECSAMMSSIKAGIVSGAGDLIALKESLFGAKSTQREHSFLSQESDRRIKVGYTIRDGWDNTAEDGVRMIYEYITSVSDADPKAKELASIVAEFLTRDKNGSLRLDNIITLERKAQELGIQEIIKGVVIIREAYRPVRTKRYVRAEYRDLATGAWITIPLGMTEA